MRSRSENRSAVWAACWLEKRRKWRTRGIYGEVLIRATLYAKDGNLGGS